MKEYEKEMLIFLLGAAVGAMKSEDINKMNDICAEITKYIYTGETENDKL